MYRKKALIVLLYGIVLPVSLFAADQPQWGALHTRNMVSMETALPDTCDPATGERILWSAPLGDKAYASPVISGGKVLIGGNNNPPRNPKYSGDRSVLFCLSEADGSLIWQLAIPKLEDDSRMDWPQVGFCSAPSVEGDRAYVLTNRYEVICFDMQGQANGNDGPYQDEARYLAGLGNEPAELDATDGDILWRYDLRKEIGIYAHDSAHASILIDGPYLYLNSGNGLDNPPHDVSPSPDAPSLIVLEKATGRLVATDNEFMGRRMIHATWASPALGEINGQRLIFFGGPNGVLYAFKALPHDVPDTLQHLEVVWQFDWDPESPKENLVEYLHHKTEGPSDMLGMPVLHGDRLYIAIGGDIWWGKLICWLKCVDATGQDDVTETAERWSYPLNRHVLSTPAVANGLAFIGDSKGILHCVDAETGEGCWTHDLGNDIWGSPLVADGKVYQGARNGNVAILAATKEKQLLAEIDFRHKINSSPVAANGILYIATSHHLYAIQ